MYLSFVYGFYRANLSKIFEVPHSSKRRHYQSQKRSKRFGNFAGEYVWFAFYMYNAETHASVRSIIKDTVQYSHTILLEKKM